MKQKIILLIVLLIALGVVGWLSVFIGDKSDNQIACTMEAKLCSDGSAVGRTGPKCEFAKCPDEKTEDIEDAGGGSDTGGGSGILPYKSGINGTVLRGPMCPVVRIGEECPDAPYETEVVISRVNTPSKVFTTMRSDKNGKFLINLPPGDYYVSALNDGISKTCDSVLVSVGSDEVKNINISCDTGIR